MPRVAAYDASAKMAFWASRCRRRETTTPSPETPLLIKVLDLDAIRLRESRGVGDHQVEQGHQVVNGDPDLVALVREGLDRVQVFQESLNNLCVQRAFAAGLDVRAGLCRPP
ncbi:MAG: hypothetical protein WCF12_14490 [Propionicimonas sp.]